jgi:hypothetical protein
MIECSTKSVKDLGRRDEVAIVKRGLTTELGWSATKLGSSRYTGIVLTEQKLVFTVKKNDTKNRNIRKVKI